MATWTILGLFIHGLTFFVLSLTVFLLQYRSHRILLARRLSWLGVFALCESLVAWCDLLIPLVPHETVFPAVLRLGLLGAGYAFLLAFGVQTLWPAEVPAARPRNLVVGLNLLWLVPVLGTLLFTFPAVTGPLRTWEVLVRYGLALPGGVLTGYGLRHQSYQALSSERRVRIRPYLQLVEASAGLFGLLNLVLVPPATFFPASWVNVERFPVPAALIWAAVGLSFMFGLLLALNRVQREVEDWIESVEQLQTLAADRERISRELHDGIIQSIYAAGLMLESIQQYLPEDPQRAQGQLGQVMETLNQTIQDIRRYIFDLRGDLPDEALEVGLRRLLRDFHINTLLETELEVTGQPPVRPLSVERRRHIFQIVREALTNTSRHARARRVKTQLAYGSDALELNISDDGVGMETLLISKGYGLRNIRERARLLDGTLRIESEPGSGVTLHLTVPY